MLAGSGGSVTNKGTVIVGADPAAGTATSNAYKLGPYASYFKENGSFPDTMLKVGRLDADFDLDNGYAEKGDYMYTGVIAGVEAGRRFNVSSFFVDPRLQLTYSDPAAETTQTNIRTIDPDSMKSLIARAGVTTGLTFARERGAAYPSASYNHDFLGDVDGGFTDGKTHATAFSQELDDNRGVVSLGASDGFTDSFNGFVDVSRSFGGDVDRKRRVNLGARSMF